MPLCSALVVLQRVGDASGMGSDTAKPARLNSLEKGLSNVVSFPSVCIPQIISIMFSVVLTLAALASSVVAQADPALEVASINAQFDAAYIFPDMLTAFDPIAYLSLQFGTKSVPAGTLLTVEGERRAIYANGTPHPNLSHALSVCQKRNHNQKSP